MVHSACVSSATWNECSATFSGMALRISTQRWISLRRYR